ncbi:IS3 family transposase [Lactobacillus rhamnosus]|nr:IS3 family transposase [Lacticaseibacillus rhamnosus]
MKDLEELKQIVNRYVTWFNHDRISHNKNGLTTIEYLNQSAVKQNFKLSNFIDALHN